MTNDERLEIRLSSVELERWKAQAEAEERSLSSWVRSRCNSGQSEPWQDQLVERLDRLINCVIDVETGVESLGKSVNDIHLDMNTRNR